jgi:seryl-tRNA synthetase
MAESIERVLEELVSVNQRLDTIQVQLEDIQRRLERVEEPAAPRSFMATAESAASDRELGAAREQVAKLAEEKQDLERQLQASKAQRPTLKVDDLVSQFGAALGVANLSLQETAEKPDAPLKGPFGAAPAKPQAAPLMVEHMEVEVKGGVSFDEAGQVMVSGFQNHELSPENASTLRFTLRPLTKVKVVE